MSDKVDLKPPSPVCTAGLERWLREDAAPIHDQVMANPEAETVPAAEVFAGIRACHTAHKGRASG